MPIPPPAGWEGRSGVRLPCPCCTRPLFFRRPLSVYFLQCPACGRNPLLYFAGCDQGSFLGEKLARLLAEQRLLARESLDELLDFKRGSSPAGLLSFVLAAGYVKEADLLDLAHRLIPESWSGPLERATGRQPGPTKLQKVLERDRLLTPIQMQRALQEQRAKGGPLGKILIDLGYVSEEGLLRALAEELGLPFVNLDEFEPPASVLAEVPTTVALVYEALPVEIREGALTVAIADPLNASILEDLEFLLARQVRGAIAAPAALRRCLGRCYDEAGATARGTLADARELPVVERHLGSLVALLLRRPGHRLVLTVEPEKHSFQCGPPEELVPIFPPPDRIVPALTARLRSIFKLSDGTGPRTEDTGRAKLCVGGKAGRLLLRYRKEGKREEFEILLEA